MSESKEHVRGVHEKIINFFFSDDSRKWLVLILILGAVLRFLMTSHLTPVPDEMVHGTHAIGTSYLLPLNTMTQGPVWFILTDYAYRLFGISLFSARFLSFIFGTLTIILVYLVGKQVFNNKVALIASFIYAVSPFHLLWASVYMDQALMFFMLLASYFFIKSYKSDGKISLWPAIFIGIGALIKIIAGTFSLVFALFMVIILANNYREKSPLFKANLKRFFLSGLIILVLMLPLISYNYFLYKSKGIVDLPSAMYFNINKSFYQGPGLAHQTGFDVISIFPTAWVVLKEYMFKQNMIPFLLSLGGIIPLIVLLRKKEFGLVFLTSLYVGVFLMTAVSISLQTHFTFLCSFVALLGALFISRVEESLKPGTLRNKFVPIALIIIFISSVAFIWSGLITRSGIDSMRSFAEKNINNQDLVIIDSRTYTGSIAWMFNDKHYLEATYVQQIFNTVQNNPSNERMRVYYVECIADDCGWGAVGNELNQSMESIARIFENASSKSYTLNGGGSVLYRASEPNNQPYFKVYETTLPLPQAILPEVDKTHSFFFYPVRRNLHPEQAFDHYEVNGFFDKVLNQIAYLSLYASLIISTMSILIVFYLLYKDH